MTEICRRLDGIALAIELAAARMVSMSAQDVRDRLGDRFRLLSGSRRGLERHQTLRHAVEWSYDLLDDDERAVLDRCSVFAGGFDVAAATPRLRRRRLRRVRGAGPVGLAGAQVAGHRRAGRAAIPATGCWRRSASSPKTNWPPPARSTRSGIVTPRYFAEQAIAHWDIWDGPRQRVAVDWVDAELANLRAGFRWAADQGDLAYRRGHRRSHRPAGLRPSALRTGRVGRGDPRRGHRRRSASTPPPLHRRQPLLDAPGASTPPSATRRPRSTLEADPRYDPFEPGWSSMLGGRRPPLRRSGRPLPGDLRRPDRSARARSRRRSVRDALRYCRPSGGPRRPWRSPRRPWPPPVPTATPS